MAHEIQADNNTCVGYSYLRSEYYVKNLDTKTTALNAIDAKRILDITAPNNIVTLEQIVDLASTLEPIKTISYTWEDTGKYIKTICFNDYKSLAIQYNEPMLFIRGSNEIWDMSSTIGADSVSTFMWQYYTHHVGLSMNKALMNAVIDYFVQLQKPYCYNVFETKEKDEDPLKYTNQFIMNNSNGESRGEYTGTKNPDNVYTLNVYDITQSGYDKAKKVYSVSSIERNRSRINMTSLLPSGTFNTGEVIEIIEAGDNNGRYTITKIENDNQELDNATTHLIVNETFAEDYVPYYNRNILQKTSTEAEVKENSLICKKEPECQVGDLIQVIGKNHYFDNLSVASVRGNKIYVNQDISTDTSKRITADEGAKVWINAYGIKQAGFDNYTEVKSAQTISKIDVANKKIYVHDIIKANDYYANEVVYLVVDGKDYKCTVASMTATTYPANGTAYAEGFITLKEAPPAYTYNLGDEPAYIQVRHTTKTPENSMTLTAPLDLVEGDVFEVFNSTELAGTYTVDAIENDLTAKKYKVFVVKANDEEPLPEITFEEKNKGILQVRVYSERILLDISYSKRVDKVPMGQFMLDNNQQFTEYLEMYNITPPTSKNYADLSQPVSMKYYLGDGLIVEDNPSYMSCLGLYSENYKDL